MNAEVISFKPKDTSTQDIEVIRKFANGISANDSFNFFFLDATKDEINRALEYTVCCKAVEHLVNNILVDVESSTKENINGFSTMCRNVEDLAYGGIVGVGFEVTNTYNEKTIWSFMLCKLGDDKYIIRDLVCNGKRIIVRG